MSTWLLLASMAVLAAAGFAHGVFGIGFAMIATPLLALFLDYRLAVLLAAVPLLVMASSWLLANRRLLREYRMPASLLPAIAAGSLLGVTLQIGLPERAALLLLASLLAVSVLAPWLLARLRTPAMSSRGRAGALFGGLAGITEAALNVGAPFVLIYAALTRLQRLEQLIALNLCFALGKAIQLGVMSMTDLPQVSPAALALGTVASGASFHVGNGMAGRFSEARFRELLRYFLMVMIGALIVRAIIV